MKSIGLLVALLIFLVAALVVTRGFDTRTEVKEVETSAHEEWEVVKCTKVDNFGADTVIVLQTIVRRHGR